jgi:hypothetical protein
MIKTKVNNKLYFILLDQEYLSKDNFISSGVSEEELKLLTDKVPIDSGKKSSLIERVGDTFKVNFVGEYITPNNNFLSLPKKFSKNDDNCALVIEMLKESNKLGISSLITNYAFTPGEDGINSPSYYFTKLKGFFMDFFTYGFIYPKEKIKKHTNSYTKGEPEPAETQFNKKKLGPGVTYLIKDINPDKNWILSDIYYTTLLNLCDELGGSKDKEEIQKMSDFLKEKGYRLNRLSVIPDDIINVIKRYQVESRHEPIKQVLISYYSSKMVAPNKKFTITAFYTSNFWKVWEIFIQKAFNHDSKFKEEVSKEMLPQREIKEIDGKMVIKESKNYPDLFSKTKLDNGGYFKFIGDAKYYKNSLNREYNKELNDYQDSILEKYPFVALLPTMTTNRYAKSQLSARGDKELLILRISYSSILDDVVNNNKNCINQAIDLIKRFTIDRERINVALSD